MKINKKTVTHYDAWPWKLEEDGNYFTATLQCSWGGNLTPLESYRFDRKSANTLLELLKASLEKPIIPDDEIPF